MSIHIDLNPEAKMRLAQERRKSTISSIVISLLIIIIILVTLGIFLLPNLEKDNPTIVTYKAQSIEEDPQQKKKVSTNVQRKPSSPSSSQARVIASTSVSEVSIPVPDVTTDVPSVEFGDGDDFGDGWGGSGNGNGGGGGGGFGSKDPIAGALKGKLYDFKQDRRKKSIKYSSAIPNWAKLTKSLERRRFSSSAFSEYFKAPDELFLTSLAIEYSDADKGPKFFGAERVIEPSGWMAVYFGKISAPTDGKFRFRAASDDYLVLHINGKRNLVACMKDSHDAVAGSSKFKPQKGNSPFGKAQLYAGDWISLKKGQTLDITLALGERPGGRVGFILEVEQQGVKYDTASDGRKILPLFTTHSFSSSEEREIKNNFSGYQIDWKNVPVFGLR